MNSTTFPSYPGQGNDTSRQQNDSDGQQNSYQHQENSGGGGGWQGKSNNQGGGWQNKSGSGGPNSNGGWQNKGGGGGGGWQGNKGGGGGKFQRAPETDMTIYKPYCVAANSDAPPEIIAKFQEIALYLESKGYTVRTGGMEGVDEAVEKTVKKIEVHLPWRDFNNKQSKFTFNTERAFAIAKMFHPTFDTMKKGIQAFLAKNARLVLGNNVISPALFLVCWTEDGADSIRSRTSRTGFAGHPIAIASAIGIPVFNLSKPDAQQRLTFLVESTCDQN